MRKDGGFTLIELLVTISIAAILVGVGIPSMIDYVRTNRRAAATNAIVTAMQQARSTAASTSTDAVLCHSTDGTTCSGAAGPDWSEGWILFIDPNDNGTWDAGETLLAVQMAHEGVSMPSNSGTLRFNPGFRTMEGGGGTIAVCVDGGDSGSHRWVVVNATGRPRLETAEEPGLPCPTA